jgi:preprotein translocase subunit SecG
MFAVILGIHILICASLIVVVLLQSGKGGGLAGAFGGAGGVGAVFGGQTAATFLTKATRYLAIAFMVTSLVLALAVRSVNRGGTILEGLQSRGSSAATSAGEMVTPQEAQPGGQGTEPALPPGPGATETPGETQGQGGQAQTPEQSPTQPPQGGGQ